MARHATCLSQEVTTRWASSECFGAMLKLYGAHDVPVHISSTRSSAVRLQALS